MSVARVGALAAVLSAFLFAARPMIAREHPANAQNQHQHQQHQQHQQHPRQQQSPSGHEQHDVKPAAESAVPPSDVPELAGGPVTLVDLERRAGEHNPELFQAEAQIRAAEGLRRQAGLWPNPVIGYTTEENPLSSGRDGGKQGGFIEQTFVTAGKLGMSRGIFDREIERAQAARDLVRTREINRVRVLYYRTAAAQRRLLLEERLTVLARETLEVTQQLYNTGVIDLSDRLTVENEADVIDLARLRARTDLTERWRELRAAVGDPTLAPQRLDDTLDAELPRLEPDHSLAAILAGSPELEFVDLGVERARLAVARERAVAWPDVELSAAVLDNREPIAPGGPAIGSEWRADLGVRIPLFDRNQGNRAAAEAELERAGAESHRARLKLEARFAPVFAAYEQEYDRASRYRDGILPRAKQAYEMVLSRYRQMAAPYPRVLMAQRAYFEAEASYLDALEGAWVSSVLLAGMLLSEEPSPQLIDDTVLRRTPVDLMGTE